MAKTKAFIGVELAAVGDWNASGGNGRVTAEELAAIVEAAQDPMVDRAKVKIGHNSKFQDANGQPPTTTDGNPAYGWIRNHRLSPDGQKLIGDVVGVPEKLADVMLTAWPERSVEFHRNKPSKSGRTYKATLSAVAVLGESNPAVKGLAPLPEPEAMAELEKVLALYAEQDPNFAESIALITFSDTAPVPQPIDESSQGVPQSTTREGATAMPKPTKEFKLALGLKEDATDDEVAAKAAEQGFVLAPADAGTQQPPTGTPPTNAAQLTTEQQAAIVADRQRQADAAAAQGAANSPQPPAQIAAANLSEAVQSGKVVVLDAAAFAQLSEGAAAGRAAIQKQDEDRRAGILAEAARSGKVHPNSYASFSEMLVKDEAGTVNLLANMPAVFPVAAVGHTNDQTPYTAAGTSEGVSLSETDEATQVGYLAQAGFILGRR